MREVRATLQKLSLAAIEGQSRVSRGAEEAGWRQRGQRRGAHGMWFGGLWDPAGMRSKWGEVEARTQGVCDTVHLACRDNGVVIKQGSQAQKV